MFAVSYPLGEEAGDPHDAGRGRGDQVAPQLRPHPRLGGVEHPGAIQLTTASSSGRVIQEQFFFDRDEALEAAGLRD